MRAGRARTSFELALEKVVGVSVLARVLAWSPFAFLPALASTISSDPMIQLQFHSEENMIDEAGRRRSRPGGER